MSRHQGLAIGWMLFAAGSASSAPPGAIRPPEAGALFDGRTAYSIPLDPLALNPKALTVAAWVKLAGSGGAQVFMNVGRSDSGFTFYLYNNAVRMLVAHRSGAYLHADAPPPKPGTWVHYAGSYDGESIRIYMNGQLTRTVTAPGQMHGAEGKLYIGALNDHERFMIGQMDDTRIWRRVLSDPEIAALAAGEITDSFTRQLAAHWTRANLTANAWKTEPSAVPAAERIQRSEPRVLINAKDDGYRGIWYMNQPSHDEYVYKYSGGYGTYCANHIPHAWHVPKVNKTFFTYGGTTKDSFQRLIHMVSYYDHATGKVPRPTILLDKNTSDAHDNPVINVDDEGHIWIFSSSHGRGRPSYISKSRKPYSVDEFELVWTGNFSYPQPWYLSGRGFLFMHTYYDPGRTICMMTSPDGAAWSERRLLSVIGEGHYQVSRPMGKGKVGTSFMYHPLGKGLNWRTNLYYMESDDFGKTWKTADGKPLDLPLKDILNPALVREYESQGLLVYIQDIHCDSQGRPVILYITSQGYQSGPRNDPRTWVTAYWTGSAWEINGGDIISDSNYDCGAIYVERDDLWRIIGPTRKGPQAYNPGGEIALWESRDRGKHWKLAREMTAGSALNHTYVRRPVNAHPDFYGFWADGHGRKPSESRFYFCNHQGDVFRLPTRMAADQEKPERVGGPQ